MDNRTKVLVCVTMQHSCNRLIREGKRLADAAGGELSVVHVTSEEGRLLGRTDEAQAMDFLFTAASEAGAQLQVVRSNRIADTLADFAAEYGATDMVIGQGNGKKNNGLNPIIDRVTEKLPDLEIHVIPEKGKNR